MTSGRGCLAMVSLHPSSSLPLDIAFPAAQSALSLRERGSVSTPLWEDGKWQLVNTQHVCWTVSRGC